MPTPTVGVSPVNDAQYFDNDGNPLSGGKLFFYVGGSFSSAKTTYSDNLGTIPNANPIVLDSSGRPSTDIWFTLNQPYNVALTLPDGTTVLESWENMTVITGSGGGGGGTPAGDSYQVQYNDNGNFAANANVEIISGELTTHNRITVDNKLKISTGNSLYSGPLTGTYPGTPYPNAPLVYEVLDYLCTFPTNFANSTLTVDTAPTDTAVFTIYLNNTQIGNCTIAAGQTTGVFSVTESQGYPGQEFYISCPDPSDATLADVNATIVINDLTTTNITIGADNVTANNQYGTDSIAIGYQALNYNTNYGGTNIGIGSYALNDLSDGANNIGIGYSAMGFDQPYLPRTGCSDNIVIGRDTLNGTIPSNQNVVIGNNAGGNWNHTANNNVLVGHNAGNGEGGTVSGSTVIGHNMFAYGSLTNSVIIGANGTQKLRFNDTGAMATSGTNYGNSGQALISQGSGAAPTWGDVSSNLSVYQYYTNEVATRANFNNKIALCTGAYAITTINAGVFQGGDSFVIVNGSNYPIYINAGGGLSMTWAGTANTGNRVLFATGTCTVLVTGTNSVYISGAGLT